MTLQTRQCAQYTRQKNLWFLYKTATCCFWKQSTLLGVVLDFGPRLTLIISTWQLWQSQVNQTLFFNIIPLRISIASNIQSAKLAHNHHPWKKCHACSRHVTSIFRHVYLVCAWNMHVSCMFHAQCTTCIWPLCMFLACHACYIHNMSETCIVYMHKHACFWTTMHVTLTTCKKRAYMWYACMFCVVSNMHVLITHGRSDHTNNCTLS